MFGQKFIIAFDGRCMMPEMKEFCRRFGIGGVILFADNYTDPAALRETVLELQRDCTTGVPLLVATDHEGGRVQRFRHGFTALPPMAELGRGPPEATFGATRSAAQELSACGINLNLAPVADVNPADRAGAIGDRAFGDNPGAVAAHVAAAVRGIQSAGVAACAKHFPGHGPTETDSHRALPVVIRPEARLAEIDLLPFAAAIGAGVAAIMTAHAIYAASGDHKRPASLSPYWIGRVLRGTLGFAGLVVSDALEMTALSDHWSPTEAGARAIAAGTDILIYYLIEEQLRAVHDLCLRHERSGFDTWETDASLARIRRTKARWIGDCGVAAGAR